MNTGLRLSFRRGDWLVIALVVALAAGVAAAFLPGADEGGTVQIFREGRLVRELPISGDAEVRVEGEYTNTVTIAGGRVSISDSDCPGRDCVHSDWIDSAGRSLVCLPNRVEVRVTSEGDVDFTVR